MKLKQISIFNYRGIKELKNMQINDLCVFIGENDVGKSTVLKFIKLMLSDRPKLEGNSDFFNYSILEESTIKQIIGELIFEPDDNFLQKYPQYVIDNRITLKEIFINDLPVQIKINSEKYYDDRLNNISELKKDDLNKIIEDYKLVTQRTNEERKKIIETYLLSENSPSKITDFVDLNWHNIKDDFPLVKYHDVEEFSNPKDIMQSFLGDIISTEIENNSKIKKYIYSITKLLTRKIVQFNLKFKEYVLKYNNEINDLIVNPEFDFTNPLGDINIDIKDRSRVSVCFENKGTGTQKRLFLSTLDYRNAHNISKRAIIECYDEPDNNLHIRSQRDLSKLLYDACNRDKNIQIILATHSLFLIDTLPTENIVLLRKDYNGNISFDICQQKYKEHKYLISREMGLTNSQLFFEKVFVLVEGPTEVNYISIIYEKVYKKRLIDDGIMLINLNSCCNATDFIKLLFRNKKDCLYILLDSDVLTSKTHHINKDKLYASYNKYDDGDSKSEFELDIDRMLSNNVIYIGTKEFEDTFTNKFFVRVFNKRYPKQKNKWQLKDIQSIRSEDKFSDKLIHLIRTESKLFVSKPDIGEIFAKESNIKDIPPKIMELFDKIQKVIKT